MYLDFGMNDENLDELIHNIRVRHKDIGIKDDGLADRLGKLFEGIYSDFNQGAYAFGMYRGLFIQKADEYPEQDYFIDGIDKLRVPNQLILHSLFTSSLTSLRRVIDESRDWKKCHCIKNLQWKIKNEIKKKIPGNQEVLEWFDDLSERYENAKNKIEPLLTYIDDRVAHHNRKWNKTLIQSTALEIRAAFESVNAYNNAFRIFYKSGTSGTMIGEGEIHARLFLHVYYGCERYSHLRNAILDALGDSP